MVISTSKSGITGSWSDPLRVNLTEDRAGFVGDYEGMAVDRDGRSVHTFFAQASCDTTNCPAVGSTVPVPGSQSDPFDVYSDLLEEPLIARMSGWGWAARRSSH